MTEDLSIKISPQNHEKLITMSKNLERLLNKKSVSIDQVISVLLSAKHVEEAIADMVLADTPHWKSTKKKVEE